MPSEPLPGVPTDSHAHANNPSIPVTATTTTTTPTTTTFQHPPEALPELCAQVHARVQAFLQTEPATERLRGVQEQSRRSLGVLEEALEKYSLDELSLSYNGGKDCLVLLILYLSALHARFSKPTAPNADGANPTPPMNPLPQTLRSVYIVSAHPFPQVDDFVATTAQTYHLDLTRLAKPMREAFADYLSTHQNVKAIFVGTRRTDPHGADLTPFDPTDRGWPAFMRIHPVIDWHYAEIWAFIRGLGIPYCGLYDAGYTSLGGTEDTLPNPALRIEGVEGGYRPAFELVLDEAERLGRDG